MEIYHSSGFSMIKHLNINEVVCLTRTVKGFYEGSCQQTMTRTIDCWTFHYVESGSIDILYKGALITVKKGEAIFFEPSEQLSFVGAHEDVCYIYHFAAKSVVLRLLAGKKYKMTSEIIRHIKKVYALGDRSLDDKDAYNYRMEIVFPRASEKTTAPPFWQQEICMNLELIVINITKEYKFEEVAVLLRKPKNVNDISFKIASFLEENINNKLTIADICVEFQYSEPLLSLRFKQVYNCGIMEYFNNLKMDEAKKMLAENHFTLKEIADNLGYSNAKVFAQAFKRKTGASPRLYTVV